MFSRSHPRRRRPQPALPPPPLVRSVPARSVTEGDLLVLDGGWVDVVHVDGHDLVRVAWKTASGEEGISVFAGTETVVVSL